MKIAHLVNPIIPRKNSDLIIAQPVTFESMRVSASLARPHGVEVELLASIYREDVNALPEQFIRTKDLDRSVLDLSNFNVQRKLPLLRDLLKRAYDSSDADYVIYTNVDIAVQPYFYSFIARMMATQDKPLIINRRTISQNIINPSDLALMYSQVGSPHPGFDCFVFRREQIPYLDVGNVCIGVEFIGLAFMLALHALNGSIELIEDAHLTFHIGDDMNWKNQKLSDYASYNTRETLAVINRLENKCGKFNDTLPSWSFEAVCRIKGESTQQLPETKRMHILLKRLAKEIGKYLNR